LKNGGGGEGNSGFPWQPEVEWVSIHDPPVAMENPVLACLAMKIATLHIAACSIFIPPRPFPRLFLAGEYEPDEVSKKYMSNFRCL
jgi:hypothetical protein